MRKIRRKWLSILLTLAMLVGLMVPFAGSAVADTTYGNYSGAYMYIDADTNQEAGYAQVTEKTSWSGTGAATIYATVTLPSGITYNATADSSSVGQYVYIKDSSGNLVPATAANFYSASKNSVTVKLTSFNPGSTDDAIKFLFDRDKKSRIDVASGFSGDVKASIEIMGVDSTGKVLWVENESITVAKVVAKSVTVTADDPKTIQPGSNKAAANITIQESRAKTLSVGETVYFQIETPDVKFALAPQLDYTADMNVNLSTVPSEGTRLFYVTITDASDVLPGKLTLKLDVDPGKLVVPPSVTGDIQITVYSKKSDGSNGKISSTTLTVAKVGPVSVAVTDAKYTGGTVYAGYKDAQTVKEGSNAAEFKLKATGGNISSGKVVVVELMAGQFGSTPFTVKDKDGNTLSLTINTFNDSKSAWFETPSGQSELKLTDFSVVVPGDTPAGDLVVKVSGTAGASGEVVIGKIAKPFSVTADAPEIVYLGQGQAAGDIVITEAAAGKILAGKLYLELPEGVTFDGKPTVKVTAGNIDASRNDSETDSNTLVINVNAKSGIASTIKISGIKYNVSRSALEGDVAVKIWGEDASTKWDGKTIAKVVNAKIVSATKRTAVFTLGSNVYTVNGTQYTMDVAAYEKDGRTYLPVRYVAYALGVDPANVLWDGATQTVTLLKGTNAIQLTIGSNVLKLNGISITMDVAPELVSGRTMLPFRFIAQALGASVSYDEATQTVTMNLE